MSQKFLLQRGFGMVQAMVLAGLVAGGALIATRIINDLKLTQRGAATRDDLETLHASLASALQDSANCTANLQVRQLGAAPRRIVLADSTPTVYTDNPVLIQEGGTYMGNSVKVDTINFGATLIEVSYSRLKSDAANRLGSGYGGKEIKKSLAIQRIPDTSIDIGERCYLDVSGYNTNSAQEFCEGLGSFMAWDAVNKKCTLSHHACPANTVFIGIDSNGTEICRNLNSQMNASNLFDIGNVSCPARTQIRLVVDPGTQKIKIECTGCTASPTCTTIAAGYCASAPAQSDNCGTSCGIGTKSSGCSAILAWTPLNFDFGNVTMGGSSADQIFTLNNSGTASTTGCSAPTITDTTNFTLTPSGNCVGTADIAASGSCTVAIHANPTTLGAKTATLSRTCTNGGTASTTSNMITTNGVAGGCSAAPTLATMGYSPAHFFTYTFSSVDPACTMVNRAYSTSAVGPWTDMVSGCDLVAGAGTPSAGPYYFKASQSCDEGVTWSPDSNIIQRGITLTISPTTHHFGNVVVGAGSAPRTFTVTNSDTVAASSCIVDTAFGSSTDFTHDPLCGTGTIAAGGTCTFNATATPSALGIRLATLFVRCADYSGAATVNNPVYSPTYGVSVNGVAPSGCPAPTLASVVNTSGNIYQYNWTGLDPTATAVSKKYSTSATGPWTAATGTNVSPDITSTPGGPHYFTVSQWCNGTVESPNSNVQSQGFLSWSPTFFDMGDVIVGGSSAPKSFILNNTSTVVATSCSAGITGSGSDFTSDDANCRAGNIPAGGSCTTTVVASPSGTGLFLANLVATCAGGGTVSTTPNPFYSPTYGISVNGIPGSYVGTWQYNGTSVACDPNTCSGTETATCSTGNSWDCAGAAPTQATAKCVPAGRCCAKYATENTYYGSVPNGTLMAAMYINQSHPPINGDWYCKSYFDVVKCNNTEINDKIDTSNGYLSSYSDGWTGLNSPTSTLECDYGTEPMNNGYCGSDSVTQSNQNCTDALAAYCYNNYETGAGTVNPFKITDSNMYGIFM